jgi:hypothetical protein
MEELLKMVNSKQLVQMLDTESTIAKLAQDDRMYHLLESVGTKPNVVYQVKVRNI